MTGALEGIRVLDMTVWQRGASASAMRADLGADVIKSEQPSGGDPGRGLGRIERVGGLSGYFEALNRGPAPRTNRTGLAVIAFFSHELRLVTRGSVS